MRYMLHSKQSLKVRKFSGGGQFELHFERDCNLAPALFFVGKTEGANCWKPLLVHVLGWDDALTVS